MFVLHTSKTHGVDAQPQIIKINSLGYDPTGKRIVKTYARQQKGKLDKLNFCPFDILRRYIQIRRSRRTDDEQFFILQDRTPVTANLFRSQLKKLLAILGFNPVLYGTHSLRAGRASDMLHLYSISIETIKSIGRWRSNSVYQYLKQ